MENNVISADEIKYTSTQVKAEVRMMSCKRVFNIGNYNTRHLEMISNVAPGADVDAVAEDLVRKVERAAKLKISESDLEPKPKPAAESTENFDDKPF